MTAAPRLSDRTRFILVISAAAALIVASVFLAIFNEAEYRSQAREAASVQARTLAATVGAALVFGDRVALQDYVDSLRVNPNVDAVGVYDDRGHLSASYSRAQSASRLMPTLRQVSAADRPIIVSSIVERGTRLGTVYLRYRTEPPLQRLSHYLGPALLFIMASMMFLIMALDVRRLRRLNRSLLSEMQEREKAEAALRQSQKMEAIGRLTGGIAHDFNNMLAIVLGNLDMVLHRHTELDPRSLRPIQNALDGATRASELTRRLLAFSRLQPLKPSSVDVAKSVIEMTDMLRRILGETIIVEAVSAGGLWRAHVDPAQLQSSVINLAINARDAMPGGGKLTIEMSNVYLDRAYAADDPEITPGQYVMIAVTDTGSGIPPGIIHEVFEPFFTTKAPGLGTGLGLSQVQGFIKQSGGHIRIYSELAVGTTVKLYVPRSVAENQEPKGKVVRPPRGQHRNLTVLIAEDEGGVREFAEEALSELGYEVLSAPNGQTALELIDQHPEISLLLTDVVMPEMNGSVLAREARKRAPSLAVVFMTGYTRNAIIHNGVLDADVHLVSKPFTLDQLGAELEAALAAKAPQAEAEGSA